MLTCPRLKMDLSVRELVDKMQKRLQEQEGFVLYSKTFRYRFSFLVMFDPKNARFAIFTFLNDDPAIVERVDCFLDVARSKASAFANLNDERI